MLNNKVPYRRRPGSRPLRPAAGREPQQASSTMAASGGGNKPIRTQVERSTGGGGVGSTTLSPLSSKRIVSAGRVDGTQKQTSPRIEVPPRVNSIAARSYKTIAIKKNDVGQIGENIPKKKTTKLSAARPATSPSSPRDAVAGKKIRTRSGSAEPSGSSSNVQLVSEPPMCLSSPMCLFQLTPDLLVEVESEVDTSLGSASNNNDELNEGTTTINAENLPVTSSVPPSPTLSPSIGGEAPRAPKVEANSTNNQQERENKYVPLPEGFDLKDHLSLEDLNDFDNDTDEEELIFGKHPFEIHLRNENFLKVDSSISFSPCIRPSKKKSRNVPPNFDPHPPGCFEAVVTIHNTSKFNMTFAIKGSSIHMFRYSTPVGFIYPESSVEVRIMTNPKYRYRFDEIIDAYFVVHGYPLLFRNQLLYEKLDAFWRAVDCDIIPMDTIEIHPIKHIYPKYDSMLDNLSILGRIQSTSIFFGSDPRIEYLDLPSIDLLSFNKLWSSCTYSRLLTMHFKLRQLRRFITRNELEMKAYNDSLVKAFVYAGSCIICYVLVFAYLFLGVYPIPPPVPWYEAAYNSFTGQMINTYESTTGYFSTLFNSIWS